MTTDQPAPQTELDQARDLLDVALGQRDEARTALASLRAAAEADTVEHERVRAQRDELATQLDTACDAVLDADERWILACRERDQLRDELALLVGPPRETPTSRIGQQRRSVETGCGERRSDEPDRVCALSAGHFGAWHADHHGAWTNDDTTPAAAPANGAP